MRKIFITLAAAALTSVAAAAADGDVFRVGNLNFRITSEAEKTCEVAESPDVTGDVIIPSSASDGTTDYAVTAIGPSAFSGNRSITSLDIPTTVTALRTSALEKCSGISTLVIPNSVTTIETRAVYGCEGLESLTISNAVKDIPVNTFSGCAGLLALVIPDGVETIGPEAFNFCKRIRKLSIGSTVKSIGRMAFSGCEGLTQITIPASVTSIDMEAFSYCIKVAKVTLERSETSLAFGSDVFGDKTYADAHASLTSVAINRNFTCDVADYAEMPFAALPSLTEIKLGGLVTEIPRGAFHSDTFLMEIDLPASVKSIGADAFAGCTKLVRISARSMEPPTASESSFDAFSYASAALNVPASSLDAYKAAPVWKSFDKITGQDWAPLLTLTPGQATIKVGETLQLVAVVREGADASEVVFTVDLPDVAEVSDSGLVTAKAEGTAVVTASITVEGEICQARCTVKVEKDNSICSIVADGSEEVEIFRADGVKIFAGRYSEAPRGTGLCVVRTNTGATFKAVF